MSNQLQRLAMMHAALVPEIKTLAERFADMLVLVEALGHQINAALASSDESPAQTFDQLGGFGFDRGPEPVETNEIGAIVHSAEFAPDHEPTTSPVHDAAKPKRAKTEYTAKEWGYSQHFVSLMKKAPFKSMTFAEHVAKRDEFVASVPADEKMNRWGQRFAKFCGVST